MIAQVVTGFLATISATFSSSFKTPKLSTARSKSYTAHISPE